MIPVHKDQSKSDIFYEMFSNQPYVPQAYWTTNRGFELDPLYQHSVSQDIADVKMQKHEPEFVPDTTFLVPPPGSDPGSPDFQSGAMTTSAKEASLVPGHGFEPRTL